MKKILLTSFAIAWACALTNLPSAHGNMVQVAPISSPTGIMSPFAQAASPTKDYAGDDWIAVEFNTGTDQQPNNTRLFCHKDDYPAQGAKTDSTPRHLYELKLTGATDSPDSSNPYTATLSNYTFTFETNVMIGYMTSIINTNIHVSQGGSTDKIASGVTGKSLGQLEWEKLNKPDAMTDKPWYSFWGFFTDYKAGSYHMTVTDPSVPAAPTIPSAALASLPAPILGATAEVQESTEADDPSSSTSGQIKPVLSNAFNPVETAVVNFLLSDQNSKMTSQEKNALRNKFKSNKPADTEEVRKRIKSTLQDYLMGKDDTTQALDTFLSANADALNNVSKKDITNYFSNSFCAPSVPVQVATSNLGTSKPLSQLKGVVGGASMDASGGVSGGIKGSGTPVQVASPQNGSVAPNDQNLRTACAISDSNNSSGQRSSGLDKSGAGNLTSNGDHKRDSLLHLDAEGKRDSAAFGIMTGGVFGLLAMGAAAGPAGLFAAVLIGGLIGFFGYAMSHPKKKKDDE